jgi:hypothetical protein
MGVIRRSFKGGEPSCLPVPYTKVGTIHKTKDTTTVCPYTLESRKDCQTIKRTSSNKVCFFTLERCSF